MSLRSLILKNMKTYRILRTNISNNLSVKTKANLLKNATKKHWVPKGNAFVMTIINFNFNNLSFRNTTTTHSMTQATLICFVINMKIICTTPYILSKKTKLNTLYRSFVLVIIQYDIFYSYNTSQNLNSFTYNYIMSLVAPFQLNFFESPPLMARGRARILT